MLLYIARTDPEVNSMTEAIQYIIQTNVSESHLDQLQPLLTFNNKEYVAEPENAKPEEEGIDKYLRPVDLL